MKILVEIVCVRVLCYLSSIIHQAVHLISLNDHANAILSVEELSTIATYKSDIDSQNTRASLIKIKK